MFEYLLKNFKKLTKIFTIFSLFLILSGCATLFGNNRRDVSVVSNPPGAAIYMDNMQYGFTPAIITLPTYIYGGKSITLKKEGYYDQTMMVNTEFQPIALLNIFFWPGFLIDAGTGNLVKINPCHLNLSTELRNFNFSEF
ncbi:MAG: PEGA domain-containing protein [Candidatus Protochlamydia sp.]|nr:PEGA domain-containing protein [Candidatus Protochlamydia sp.]